MKAILIALLLVASVAFLPTSTLAARELVTVGTYTVTSPSTDPSNPAIKCPPGSSYSRCLPPSPPAP